METPNSMTKEEIKDSLDSVFKALILQYVKLDMTDSSTISKWRVECPAYEMNDIGIVGIPYIYSDASQSKIYITYEQMRRYGLVQSELIYHARKNTLEILNSIFNRMEKEPDATVAEDTDTGTRVIALSKLNKILETEKGEK